MSIGTLRYYERRGLLRAPARGPNGHREYDEASVAFVRSVKEAQQLGFSLAEIEEQLELAQNGADTEEQRARVATTIEAIDAKMAALGQLRAGLERALGSESESLDRATDGAAVLAGPAERTPEPAPAPAPEPESSPEPAPEPALTVALGPPLHVTNGDGAGNVLRRSSLSGAVLAWQDALHEGPLAPVPPAELRKLRAEFLGAGGWGDPKAILAELERRDTLLQQTLEAGRPVILWFEHDLFDQLQLLQILALVAESERGLRSVLLVVVGEVPGRESFDGLGDLSPEELEPLWDLRRPLTPEVLALGRAGWKALCAPNPRGIEALLRGDTRSLPFLGAALRRLLEELPDTYGGLSRTERQILEAVEDGARTPWEVFAANAEREEAPYLGDAWLWVRLHELGTGKQPLLATVDGRPLPVPPPRGNEAFTLTRLALTEIGRAVLAGGLDGVEVNGIDRWLGGTHLRPGNVWRWDRTVGRLVAPAEYRP